MSSPIKSAILLFSTISFLILVTFFACAKKEKQAAVQQSEPSAQQAQAPATVTPPQPAPAPAAAPAASEPSPSYDYTDIKDVEMDGSAAIGKTCKMPIMMDYSGINEGTFRATACKDGQAYTGKLFRMSFGPSTRAAVKNMKSMECTSGDAVFKITGKGRIEDYTAKLIELSAY